MRRVAIFGNTGGGKSTLARRLADATGLPLHPLDLIQFCPGGEAIPHDEYLTAHAELLRRDAWIIDGFGCADSAWQRFARADTLVYIDLPLATHFCWVVKRFLRSWHTAPEGWPERSPMWQSTVTACKVVWQCHHHMTPRYRRLVVDAAATKRVHHITSPAGIASFLSAVRRELADA